MGWRGTIRSVQAAYRKAERESLRRQRELERQRKQMEKLEEIERAAYEVQLYENHIELLLSVHKECGEEIDWQAWADAPEPKAPEWPSRSESEARNALQSYQPGFLDRLFKREETKRAQLEVALEQAKQADETAYQRALKEWSAEHREWEETNDLAKRIIAGDPGSQIEAIKKLKPFSDIGELGSSLSFSTGETGSLEVVLQIHGDEVIPKEIKSQLKSGRLSVKQMPKSKFNELFQDYVCSCVLRVANEIFSILPVDLVLVHAFDRILNTHSGHLEETAILSVLVPRATLRSLNLNHIDPSDSMKNFIHRMNFKKTKGFMAVEALKPEEVQSSEMDQI